MCSLLHGFDAVENERQTREAGTRAPSPCPHLGQTTALSSAPIRPVFHSARSFEDNALDFSSRSTNSRPPGVVLMKQDLHSVRRDLNVRGFLRGKEVSTSSKNITLVPICFLIAMIMFCKFQSKRTSGACSLNKDIMTNSNKARNWM
jgi:hypothetical protein